MCYKTAHLVVSIHIGTCGALKGTYKLARTKAATLTTKDGATLQKADKNVERLRGEMDSVPG